MLPRKSHLPYKEFRIPGYQKEETPYFSVRAKKNLSAENRFGVVIGTASLKSAARRNFWRRQAKSVFLMSLPKKQTGHKQGFDILVIFRSRAPLLQKNVLRKTLARAMASLISRL
jgi:ribonuclease P protein component